MSNEKVSIDKSLFFDLCKYHIAGDKTDGDAIQRALESKLDAMVARQHYSAYKTSLDPQEREAARKRYLDHKHVPEDYRT